MGSGMNYVEWDQLERLAKIEKLLVILVMLIGVNSGFWGYVAASKLL